MTPRGRRWADGSSAARKDGADGHRAIQNGGPAVPLYLTTFRPRLEQFRDQSPPRSAPCSVRCGPVVLDMATPAQGHDPGQSVGIAASGQGGFVVGLKAARAMAFLATVRVSIERRAPDVLPPARP